MTYATGVLYSIVVLLALRMPKPVHVLYAALGCSVLATTCLVIAFAGQPAPELYGPALVNCCLALASIWFTAVVGYYVKTIGDHILRGREDLEDSLVQRATILERTNIDLQSEIDERKRTERELDASTWFITDNL